MIKSLVVERQDLYDIVEIINDNTFISLKKFHAGGGKKIIYRTYYGDKSSVFVQVTLNNDNTPVEGLFDINTYKQSKKAINGTYRIEYFNIGLLNGEPSTLATLYFISRRGKKEKVMDITMLAADIPKTIADLDGLLAHFEEKICSSSGRTYTTELFKISSISSQIELLDIAKEKLSSNEQVIIDGIVESLIQEPQIEPKL